jgi:signal transduction histidine kinase
MKRYFVLLPLLVLLFTSLSGTVVSADDSVTIRVGVYENSPKIFTDDQGNVSGFWPEIIEYIAEQENWKIEYVHGTWAECLQRLGNNEIDVMPDVAYTEERSALYNFSNEVVYTSWSQVYTKKGTGIQSVLDFEGKNIAVLKGSVNVEGTNGIKSLVNAFGINCNFIEVDSYTRVFELVESGEADAGVTSKDFGYQYKTEFNLNDTPIVFQPALIYFAFPKDSSLAPNLIERIDSNMKELKEDGSSIYYQSLGNWFGITSLQKTVFPDWAKWLLIGIGGLVFLLAGGSIILRSQVRSRTKELTEEIIKRKQADEALVKSYGQLEELVKKRTVELTEKTGELEEANFHLQDMDRHKSVFLANMSHELRTPLNSIIGYTKLMYDGLEGDVNEEQKKDLQAVYSNGKNLLELINGLLDLSKIEAGKMVLSYEVFPISNLLTEIITTIEPLAKEKGLTLTSFVAPGIDRLYADRAKTRQVLINILGNAVKFTPKGGIKLDITENENSYMFSVTDTGMGIKKENLEIIFDSFVQVGPSQIAGYAGTGLGLAVCKQFIELQGGKIWAESELGQGSKFIFILPKNKTIHV